MRRSLFLRLGHILSAGAAGFFWIGILTGTSLGLSWACLLCWTSLWLEGFMWLIRSLFLRRGHMGSTEVSLSLTCAIVSGLKYLDILSSGLENICLSPPFISLTMSCHIRVRASVTSWAAVSVSPAPSSSSAAPPWGCARGCWPCLPSACSVSPVSTELKPQAAQALYLAVGVEMGAPTS